MSGMRRWSGNRSVRLFEEQAMQYLVKVFKINGLTDYTPKIASDDGDEYDVGSLWRLLWSSKREDLGISVYRMLPDISAAKEWEEILMIDHEGNLVVERLWNIRSLDELAADSSIKSYRLQSVLDLS
jgi:hypothetical protein